MKCNQHIFDMECFVGSFAELFLQNRTIKDIVKTVQNEALLIKCLKKIDWRSSARAFPSLFECVL